jgi:endoglucanase
VVWLARKSIRQISIVILLLGGAMFAAPTANAYYSGEPTPGNPLAGHPWFVDKERGSWWVALRTDPVTARPLSRAADNPMGKTFGSWIADPGATVRDYIDRAESEEPGSIPFLNLARIESQACPYPGTTPGFTEPEIEHWVRRFSAGIGTSLVMVIIETDKLTTIGCLPRWARARRYRELRYEVHLLHQNNPNAIVYIDAGSEDWGKDAATMARWLRRADVAEAQGFALGASHHDWTYKEVRLGLQISRRLGGKHFVVNTDSNGWGPKPHGWTPWASSYHPGCTPPGEGLGIVPTVKTPDPHIDAFLWLGTPGFDLGRCVGLGLNAPYMFYLQEALMLVRNANPPL